MAAESVTTTTQKAGSTHDLWLGDGSVLTIGLDRDSMEFPPVYGNTAALNGMIQGLARAAKSVIYQADNDESSEANFAMQPIEDIVNTIVMLSQLSEAVQSELRSDKGN